MGSRNLNAQAKLLITQPSITSFTQDPELGIMSPSMLSGNDRYSRRQTKMTLPSLTSPRAPHDDSLILSLRQQKTNEHVPFELQPQQKNKALATSLVTPAALGGDDLETIIKRKGKVSFMSNSLPRSPKQDDTEDVQLAFKQDQGLLRNLLANCKSEDKDSKISMHQLGSMLSEAKQAQNRFNMVFGILEELEGVDARAIEQLFYYKINGL